MKALVVFNNMLDRIWPMVLPMLAPAIELFDGYAPVHIFQDLKNNKRILFIAVDDKKNIRAALVMTIVSYPLKKTCYLQLVGGENVETWLELMNDIEEFAVNAGCDDIEFNGRHGWSKLLTDFESPARLYRKRLR